MNEQKALPGDLGPDPERRSHLRNYLFACVRDNLLTSADLVSLDLPRKLLKTVSADLDEMKKDMTRVAGAGVGQVAEWGFLKIVDLLRGGASKKR